MRTIVLICNRSLDWRSAEIGNSKSYEIVESNIASSGLDGIMDKGGKGNEDGFYLL